MQVEKELQDLRERLDQVEKWQARRQEIEDELAQVWVEGGESLDPPAYVELEKGGEAKHEEGEMEQIQVPKKEEEKEAHVEASA
ncbi:hypothetical protein BN1723_018484, partial [Verticillium longisporum]